jgi:hypothetical protein
MTEDEMSPEEFDRRQRAGTNVTLDVQIRRLPAGLYTLSVSHGGESRAGNQRDVTVSEAPAPIFAQ